MGGKTEEPAAANRCRANSGTDSRFTQSRIELSLQPWNDNSARLSTFASHPPPHKSSRSRPVTL